MFEKTFVQMQDTSKQWAAVGRRITREALAATSQSLEAAARYLDDLKTRLADTGAAGPTTSEEGAEEPAQPAAETGSDDPAASQPN